ncbi:MAG: hypothetical protein WBM41_20075 [Arenicellales bacterium]
MINNFMKVSARLFIFPIVFIVSQTGFAAEYEEAPVFKASQLLNKNMRAGENFTVNEKVVNHGFMNQYTVETKWGDFTAKSDAQLRLGLHEVSVMGIIEEMLANDEVTKAAGEQGTDTFENAKKLVSNPGEVLDGAVEGTKKLFSLGKRAWNDKSASSTQEDSKWESLVGFSSKKREYAAQFKIDPYTTNPLMEEALDKLTWTTHSTKLASGFLVSLIPVVGVAATVSNTSDVLNEVMVLKSPLELREDNIRSLSDVGINQTVIDLFMRNEYFTPTSQTLFVEALASMKSTKGLEAVIGIATLSDDVETATLRQRQMQMYASYHKHIKPIKHFSSLGDMAYAKTSEDTTLVVSPVDYLFWTKDVDEVAKSIRQNDNDHNGKLELWIAGKFSEATASMLKDMGWSLHINAENSLLGNADKS